LPQAFTFRAFGAYLAVVGDKMFVSRFAGGHIDLKKNLNETLHHAYPEA